MINKWLLKILVHFQKRKKFRQWTTLEDKKYSFLKAVEDSIPALADSLYAYLSTAISFPVNFDKIYWIDTLEAFYKIHDVNSTIREIPLTSRHDGGKSKKDSWDYPDRLWPMYLNIIASAYGWSEKQIADLDVNMALAYLQEILTTQQLDKEFVWSTTEVAFEYNKQTKKSKFKPLPRPYWMREDISKPIGRKAPPIPKSLLPVGNIVKLETNEIKTTIKAT